MKFKKVTLIIIILAFVACGVFYLTNYFKEKVVLSEIDRLFTDVDYLNKQVGEKLTFTSSKACEEISENAKKYGWSKRGQDRLYTDGGSYEREYTTGVYFDAIRSLKVFCKWDMKKGEFYRAYVTVER